ncbi:PREDICTED: myosin light chain 5 isoform X3 [Hipposideros armiger]|uniref:Myosin light chain 5 isoform X3 n=1 Tax=Hipposideros armiger TaxID=186990 RepID=A0A8B7SMI1_HIPAR|nr:PREDICTED: myosin light chain 5 isoform X3 [Hipposideros armiger]
MSGETCTGGTILSVTLAPEAQAGAEEDAGRARKACGVETASRGARMRCRRRAAPGLASPGGRRGNGVRPLGASRKTKKKEGGALRAQRASSNVFSNFEQTQIQEFKEAFTLMDQNRDGFIDKEDLKDTYASLGKINVKDEELDAMLKEATGPINFTMFLNMFGEKLSGTDAEDTILNAFKMLDPEGKGSINKDYIKRLLMSQADKMTADEVDQMLQFATIDAAGNLDYKALSYVLTHGEEKEE